MQDPADEIARLKALLVEKDVALAKAEEKAEALSEKAEALTEKAEALAEKVKSPWRQAVDSRLVAVRAEASRSKASRSGGGASASGPGCSAAGAFERLRVGPARRRPVADPGWLRHLRLRPSAWCPS